MHAAKLGVGFPGNVDRRLQVWVPAELLAAIERAAAAEGKTLSRWVRELLERAAAVLR